VSERIIVKGNTKLLKPVITEIMALRQLLENLEIEGGGSEDKETYPGRRYNPQIRLHFLEDTNYNVRNNSSPGYQGRKRQTGRLTFRLMDELSTTISKGELTRIGTTIKNLFGANKGYVWNKGKEMYCYADWSKGYQLQILARTTTQAKDLVTKILSIQNHVPQWIFLTKNENQSEIERYPETPQTQYILGEQVTLATVRPLVEVRFTYADARIHKLIKPVIVYDRTNKKVGALVR